MRVNQFWETKEVLPSAARTSSGGSAAFTVGGGDHLAIQVDVTAVSGTTPSMTVSVEWYDGSQWFQADPAEPFTAITAASSKVKSFTVKGTRARVNFAITGTSPSFTFRVNAVVAGD